MKIIFFLRNFEMGARGRTLEKIVHSHNMCNAFIFFLFKQKKGTFFIYGQIFLQKSFLLNGEKKLNEGREKKRRKFCSSSQYILSRVQGLYSFSYFASGGKPFFLLKNWIGKDDNEWKAFSKMTSKKKKCFLQNSDYINGKREKRKKNEATKTKMKTSKKKIFCRSRSKSSVSVTPNQRRAKKIHQEQLIKKKIRVSLGGILNLPQVMKYITLPEN